MSLAKVAQVIVDTHNVDGELEALFVDDEALFVDDDLSILKTLKIIMQTEGYKLLFANNADNALQILKDNDVAVIVADNNMPGISGVDFLSEAKESSPYSVRIILSGACDQACTIKSINLAQVYKFISKPFAGRNIKTIIIGPVNVNTIVLGHSVQSMRSIIFLFLVMECLKIKK